MKSRIRLPTLVVSSTVILLCAGAALVVPGIFNEALAWDLFGPKAQASLYGVFGSCMALAGFGAVGRAVLRIDGDPRHSFRDYPL